MNNKEIILRKILNDMSCNNEKYHIGTKCIHYIHCIDASEYKVCCYICSNLNKCYKGSSGELCPYTKRELKEQKKE